MNMLNECKGMRDARTEGFVIILDDQGLDMDHHQVEVREQRHNLTAASKPFHTV